MNAVDATTEPVMPHWSAYAGEAFNLTERRPVSILSESDTAIIAEDFYYWEDFWTAVIPKHGVADIIGQRLNFSKPRRQPDGTSKPSLFFMNHVQARLIMQPEHPIELYPPGREPAGEPAHRVDDFCYTVEAVGPHGRHWNLFDGLLGNLAIVHRFLSTEDVIFERIIRERMTIIQSPPLPLEPQIKNQMLCEAVRESHNAGLSRPYFIVRARGTATNCTSEPMKLLDRVLQTPFWQRFFHRFPVYPRGYLKLRGLWQDGQPPPTLNDQMAEWIAGDRAKQRRHAHIQKKKSVPKGCQPPRVPVGRHVTSFFKAIRSSK